MSNIKDKRGFTLIELIVVLGLAGIVISVVMSFFIANYKSYETINTESEVQYQSQYVINYITNIVLEAKGYDGTEFEFNSGNKSKFEVDGNKIKHTTRVLLDDGTYNTVSANIGNHVKELIINNIGSNEVRITLKLVNRDKDYSAEQIVYMRNSK